MDTVSSPMCGSEVGRKGEREGGGSEKSIREMRLLEGRGRERVLELFLYLMKNIYLYLVLYVSLLNCLYYDC